MSTQKTFKKKISFLVLTPVLLLSGFVYASETSTFQVDIQPGTLAVDIADSTSNYATVASPSVSFAQSSFSFACQSTTGTFGTATETIYVQNPDAADNGWTVGLAASDPTDVWASVGTPAATFDFNDPTTSGCADGGDTDSVAGQLSVDPTTSSTISAGDCSTCDTTGVSAGSASAYEEGVTNSIQIFSGAAGSDDIGDWEIIGVDLTQTLPGEQDAYSDYALDLTLSIVAS